MLIGDLRMSDFSNLESVAIGVRSRKIRSKIYPDEYHWKMKISGKNERSSFEVTHQSVVNFALQSHRNTIGRTK
jgi:hypothetical protein